MDRAQAISWYPGHIGAAERQLQDKWLPLLDVVVQLIDARLPLSSRYTEQTDWRTRPIVNVYSKADLADLAAFRQLAGHDNLCINIHQKHVWHNKLLRRISKAGEQTKQKLAAKGRGRKLRIGICGLPNVGKSSLLNALLPSRKKAKTGNQPGVTRQMQFVSVSQEVDLLDMPGLCPHSFAAERAWRLAACQLLPDKLFDPEELLSKLQPYLPGLHAPKDAKSAKMILKNFRQGKLGRICLDLAPRDDRQQLTYQA